MKRQIIAIAILAVLLLCGGVWARMSVVVVGQGVSAPSKQTYSDDFNRADNDSLGASWTEDVGDCDIVSNTMSLVTGGWSPIACIYASDTNTVNGYIKFNLNFGAGNTFPTIIFRYTNSSSGFYGIEMDTYCNAKWKYFANTAAIGGGTTVGAQTDLGTCNAGDDVGVTWTGTGDTTVVRMWLRPTANTPVSASEWDSGDSTPEVAWTDNPATAADTGKKMGIGGFQNTASTASVDDFYGGDL